MSKSVPQIVQKFQLYQPTNNYLLTISNRVHFTFATIIGPWATSRDTTCDPKGSRYTSLDSAKAACADDHNCFGISDTACKGKFLDLCRGGAQVKRCTRPCHFWSCPGHGYCSQWGSPSSGYEYPCIHYKPGTGRSYILLWLHFKYWNRPFEMIKGMYMIF